MQIVATDRKHLRATLGIQDKTEESEIQKRFKAKQERMKK